mgnify:CR=1 FL=1
MYQNTVPSLSALHPEANPNSHSLFSCQSDWPPSKHTPGEVRGDPEARSSDRQGDKESKTALEGDKRLNRQVAYTCDSGPFLAACMPRAEAPIL